MKHVRYQSHGNTVGLENDIDDYWEIDDEGCVVRSIHVQPDGSRLKYDVHHAADSLGQLPEGIVPDEALEDRSYGEITFLTVTEFEAVWAIKAVNESAT